MNIKQENKKDGGKNKKDVLIRKGQNMKVLVLDGVAREGLEKLENEQGITLDISKTMTEDQLVVIIKEYDAVIVRSATKINKRVISYANKLKVIGRAGVGVDNNDLD